MFPNESMMLPPIFGGDALFVEMVAGGAAEGDSCTNMTLEHRYRLVRRKTATIETLAALEKVDISAHKRNMPCLTAMDDRIIIRIEQVTGQVKL